MTRTRSSTDPETGAEDDHQTVVTDGGIQSSASTVGDLRNKVHIFDGETGTALRNRSLENLEASEPQL